MSTASLRIITINILNDLLQWEERRRLLAGGLSAAQPDLVALQEVNLPSRNAHWLAEKIGLEHTFISPKTGWDKNHEGIAILSRLPFEQPVTLDLHSQGRVAQSIRVAVDGQDICVINGHFFWQPGESNERLAQVERLLDWIGEQPGSPAAIVCGDFNGEPESHAIQTMRRHFQSAHLAIHGREPDYTCPTPLRRSLRVRLNSLRSFLKYVRPWQINPFWRGTLDYIFVDPRLRILECQVVLNLPAPGDPGLYPSDHFGLLAVLETGSP